MQSVEVSHRRNLIGGGEKKAHFLEVRPDESSFTSMFTGVNRTLTQVTERTLHAMLMRLALFWDITQRRVVILYRRFSSRPSSSLKMGPIRCPETSVKNYHWTLRNIPEDRRSHILKAIEKNM
jgi:hypothetical protein